MTKIRFFLLLCICYFYAQFGYSFPLSFEISKDSCWVDYSVELRVIDVASDKVITTMTLPAGKISSETTLEGQPKQTFNYSASYSPSFWAGDEKKRFYAKRYWSLPESIAPDISAWKIKLCYPRDFSEVPLPPTASGQCKCP